MALKERLNEDDLALVDVLEDPIFFAEFMRSTRDGSINKATWPTKEFTYRHYQRALVSDQTEKIVLLGGRAIGKCQPTAAKVYTTQGYKRIFHLRRTPVFEIFCLDDTGALVRKRAIIQKDMWTRTYKVETQSGYITYATEIHPFLTNNGYVQLQDLSVGDMVAVSTHLPWQSQQKLWRWHELRIFGYIWLNTNWRLDKPLYPKRQKIRDELRKIAEIADARYMETGAISQIMRKRNGQRSLMTQMSLELGFKNQAKYTGIAKRQGQYDEYLRIIPETLKQECLEHIQIFLEAVFSQFATFSRKAVSIDCLQNYTATELQELLLRFGIETFIDGTILHLRDERAVYRFYTRFNLPGVSVENIEAPPQSFDIAENRRYEPITSIEMWREKEITYSIYVHDYHNYISDYIHVHNSLVLEDKHLFDVINQDVQYPETKEMLLATNNQAQLEPIQGRLITRFTSSPLLKGFLKGINKSSGVFEFLLNDVHFNLRTRIAGTSGAQNMIGLHIPQINIDEGQLFTQQAWTQLAPALNDWESRVQVFIAGVANGLRNSLLYSADRKLSAWKKYRIPSHNNPYYSQETDLENIKRYGGEDTDDYKQLVAAQHGNAAFTVITRDQITRNTYPFYTYKYTGNDSIKNTPFQTVLDRPDLTRYTMLTAGIDCGYVDPTVISVVGLTDKGIWEYVARYILQRIDMATQEKVVSWLDEQYRFDKIGIDIGSGGGGTNMLHSLLYRPEYAKRQFDLRLIPVQFGERVTVGFNSDGKELQQTTKTLGAVQLVQHMQQGTLILSEIDHAAISELERITKMKGVSGDDRYFILSEKGNGASPNDHLFASMICWAIATRDMSFQKPKKKRLGKSNGGY